MPRFCSHCGGDLAFDGASFCAHCGKPQGAAPAPVAAAAPARAAYTHREEEKVLYSWDGTEVTSNRFTVPGHVFDISAITSIESIAERPSRWLQLGLGIFGFFVIIGGAKNESAEWAGIGAVIVLMAIVAAFVVKSKHAVVLHTAGGEVKAVVSTNEEMIDDITMALNRAKFPGWFSVDFSFAWIAVGICIALRCSLGLLP